MSDQEFYSKLRQDIETALDRWDCPSIGLGVIKDGEIVFLDGIGRRDREEGLPATGKTLYQIGSCSKAFTAMLCAKMVDEGKLSWDQPIREIAPEVQFYDPFTSQNVTLRDVLSHRTGVPRHEYSWYGTQFTRKELVEHVKDLEPNQPFRTRMQYNNYGYIIAGYLVEKVTGKTWEECLQEYILDPLGMTRTNAYVDGIEFDDDHASPYGRVKEGKTENEKIPFYRTQVEDREKGIGAPFGPAGSMNSSAEDMLKWIQFHLGNGCVPGNEDARIISEEALQELHKPNIFLPALMDMPHDETTNCTYSMGWFIEMFRGHKVIQHGGSINGFSAETFMVPELNLGIAAYTNMDGCYLHLSVCRTILDYYLGVEDGNWINRYFEFVDSRRGAIKDVIKTFTGEKVEGTAPSHEPEAYCGNFHREGYGPCSVETRDGKLSMHFLGREVPLAHFHYDTFTSEAVVGELPPGIPVHFHVAEVGGAIDALLMPLVTETGGKLIRFDKIKEE